MAETHNTLLLFLLLSFYRAELSFGPVRFDGIRHSRRNFLYAHPVLF